MPPKDPINSNDALLRRMEGFCAEYGVSITELGDKATGAGNLATRLKRGHGTTVATFDTISAFTRGYRDRADFPSLDLKANPYRHINDTHMKVAWADGWSLANERHPEYTSAAQ